MADTIVTQVEAAPGEYRGDQWNCGPPFPPFAGTAAATSVVITDPIPANTDFKVGSATQALGSTGLSVVIAYSSDGGTSWSYSPASGAGGAPAGYDRLVTHVRWTFTGNLSPTAPNNTGSMGFVLRIRSRSFA